MYSTDKMQVSYNAHVSCVCLSLVCDKLVYNQRYTCTCIHMFVSRFIWGVQTQFIHVATIVL